MTYEDLDIKIAITLGRRASAAVNGNGDLLIVQEQGRDNHAVINLGPLTPARAKELGEYLERLA